MIVTTYGGRRLTLDTMRHLAAWALPVLAGVVAQTVGCAAPDHAAGTTVRAAPTAWSAEPGVQTVAYTVRCQLQAVAPRAAAAGATEVAAYAFDADGSRRLLASVACSQAATANLVARVTTVEAESPILLWVTTGRGTRAALLPAAHAPGEAAEVAVAGFDDTTTACAQIYAAARTAGMWPKNANPAVLATIVAAPFAHAMCAAPNGARALAAATPGVVAAVASWQNVMDATAKDSVPLTTSPSGAGSRAAAAQAAAQAWAVYAGRLPLPLRREMRLAAVALQATHMAQAAAARIQDAAGGLAFARADAAWAQRLACLRAQAPQMAPDALRRDLEALSDGLSTQYGASLAGAPMPARRFDPARAASAAVGIGPLQVARAIARQVLAQRRTGGEPAAQVVALSTTPAPPGMVQPDRHGRQPWPVVTAAMCPQGGELNQQGAR